MPQVSQNNRSQNIDFASLGCFIDAANGINQQLVKFLLAPNVAQA